MPIKGIEMCKDVSRRNSYAVPGDEGVSDLQATK
jgi:hypothetical protein